MRKLGGDEQEPEVFEYGSAKADMDGYSAYSFQVERSDGNEDGIWPAHVNAGEPHDEWLAKQGRVWTGRSLDHRAARGHR